MAKKKKKQDYNKLLIILTIISMLFLSVFVINVVRLNVLPFKYVLKCLVVVFLVHVIIYLLGLLRNKFFKVLSYILIVFTIIIYFIGTFYTGVTISFLRKAFNKTKTSYTISYVLLSTNNYNEVYDLNNQDIAYYDKIPHIDKGLEKLNSMIDYNKITVDNINGLFNYSNILIEKNTYNTIKNSVIEIDIGKYKVTYEFSITIEEEFKPEEIKDIVTIYIGGFDFTDACNDLNMLVTINRKTHKVLLTSIPRDYYMYFNDLKMDEKLDYVLKWGVNVPIEGLSSLFDVDIDYYVTVDTSSIVGLVDEIGGVDFCSDFTFTTTHATILDDYDDSKGNRLRVQKGCHQYNGIEILTIARERLAFQGGDRQRQKNCQQILINIVNKLMSFDSVTKYTSLLNKLDDLYTTNIPDKLITSVAKDFIDGNKYEIEQQSADGYSSAGWMHIHTYYGGVLRPYTDSVEKVKTKLKEYYN